MPRIRFTTSQSFTFDQSSMKPSAAVLYHADCAGFAGNSDTAPLLRNRVAPIWFQARAGDGSVT
jgi:hypothetical protein